MAKKDYHLTQTGQEVQDILNEAQRVYQCLPEQVEHPDEGDICFVPAHDENIDLEYVSGSQTEPFLIPEGVHLIKTKIVAPAVANWIVVIRRPQEMGINLITTGEVPEEYVANIGVEPGTTPYIYWYDKDESYLQYLTVYYEVAAVCYEYMNGSWVERADLAQTLEKAKSAYQKPASGIPKADLADGVQTSLGKADSALQPGDIPEISIPITYAELLALRTGGNLVPGAFYRITDYLTTTTDTESRALTHQFDIVVKAIDTTNLSEEAMAAHHDGDTYFANNDLGAWKLWYCLDNDTTRFSWADTTNGKGIIYRMIDEYNNDVPYDFKNIQFKRYKVTAKTSYTVGSNTINLTDSIGVCNGLYIGLSGNTSQGFDIDAADFKWYYTFSLLGSAWTDEISDGSMPTAFGNNIGSYCNKIHGVKSVNVVYRLNNIVFSNGVIVDTWRKSINSSVADSDCVAANCEYGDDCYNIMMLGEALSYGSKFSHDNIFVCGWIGEISCAPLFVGNTVVVINVYANSTISEAFRYNILFSKDSFGQNTIGTNFNNNVIITSGNSLVGFYGNTVSEYFQNNLITIQDYNMGWNFFGSQFSNNTITGFMQYCSIGENFNANTITGRLLQSSTSKSAKRNSFLGVINSCTFNGQINDCVFNGQNGDIQNCTFNGILGFVTIPSGSGKFAHCDVMGGIRGASGTPLLLDSSDFRISSVTGNTRRITIQSDVNGNVIATWKDNGVDKGIIKAAGASTWTAYSTEQVQADWNQSNNAAKDFIKNKPTIPTVPTDVVKYTAQTLTDTQQTQARTNIGATAPEVFWATYGTTTLAEVTSAFNEGKLVACLRGGAIYVVGQLQASYCYFYAAARATLLYLIVQGNAQWTTGQVSAEEISNRVNTLSGNETATGKYPSAKAVYDAIVAGKEIFWATYGTTTASEIDAAVAAGKEVLLLDGGWVYTYGGKDSNYHYFFAITGNISYRRVQLQISTNGWARHDIGVQGTAQKVNTIIGNESDTSKYPSTKAVWDAIVDTPVIDDSESAVVPALNLESAENKAQTLSGNETDQEKYLSAKGVADALGKMGVVSQKITWSGEQYTLSEITNGLIPQELINQATYWGAVFNTTTGYFEYCGYTDIASDEMREAILTRVSVAANAAYRVWAQFKRIVLPFSAINGQITEMFMSCGKLRIIPQNIGYAIQNVGNNFFNGCTQLKEIQISIYGGSSGLSNANTFSNCSSLEYVNINNLNTDLHLGTCPNFLLSSVVNLVTNRSSTSAITITLHSTAYARCQADTTQYTYSGQTYTGILAYASAKNITIASAS